ncbi:acyltransferase [Paenibacillus sepulcri]|uniref:Acyltransferase n=1 Tax=Paenibacillus sepulcri TaxID=359917 RepID=A0ABS7BXM9_9BACL|nr:acyltransferase [Paenibacillus sepulcri]
MFPLIMLPYALRIKNATDFHIVDDERSLYNVRIKERIIHYEEPIPLGRGEISLVKKMITFMKVRTRKYFLEEVWLEDYIKLGMRIGKNCSIQPGVTFDYSHCWLIRIGNNVTIAPQAYILAHDASTKPLIGYTKVGSVRIEDDVFIGARAVIMPGITVGQGSIVAAGSVVTKSIPERSVAAGNPAKVILTVAEFEEKMRQLHKQARVYEEDFTLRGLITEDKKDKMYHELINMTGFVD